MLDILIAIALVGLIGVLAALLLVVAAKYMHVEVDETEQKIRACLPGANCGACGYTGCDGYAKALAAGGVATNLCVPGADAAAKAIANLLGTEFEDVVEKVAFVGCMGDCVSSSKKSEYRGITSCSAANMLWSGDSACRFGCLGFGDCANVCPNHAICIEDGIAHVDTRLCTGCGLCAKTCPKHLIKLLPDVEKIVVSCSNHDSGAKTRLVCKNGCIGCKKCEKNCPQGAITVVDNLAAIDYDKCVDCGLCAQNCPVGCLKVSDLSGIHRFRIEDGVLKKETPAPAQPAEPVVTEPAPVSEQTETQV